MYPVLRIPWNDTFGFRAAGFTDDEVNRCYFLHPSDFAMDQFNQPLATLSANLVQRLVNGRQAGNRETRLRNVVEADHGDVLRHSTAEFVEFLDRPKRHLVVEREDGGKLRILTEQLFGGLHPAFLREPTIDDLA